MVRFVIGYEISLKLIFVGCVHRRGFETRFGGRLFLGYVGFLFIF